MRKRLLGKLLLALVLFLLALMASGLLLADYLTPKATGPQQYTLPIDSGKPTEIDRALAPLLAQHPQQTGAVFLTDGLDAFAARAQASRQAGRSLDVQYYIWKDDLTGHLLLNELWQAANRGVRVRLLLDDINTKGKDNALLALAEHPLIEVRVYNPFRNREGIRRLLEMVQRAWSINHRMHNKAWIADGQVAIVGGRNIGKEYFEADPDTNFRDLDLMLFGPATAQASAMFDAYWNSEAVVPITALHSRSHPPLQAVMHGIAQEVQSPEARHYLERTNTHKNLTDDFTRTLPLHWSESIEVLFDPPIKQAGEARSEWLYRHITQDLASAKASAHIISPYFVPDHDSMQNMFATLAKNKVDVGIVTNSLVANDVLAVHSGYRNYRKPLLTHGFKLYEMRATPRSGLQLFGSGGASLHTKAYLVDDRKGFIGSFNMDSRSINLNTEMGVAFTDEGMARDLEKEYQKLTSPAISYALSLDAQGEIVWLDRQGDVDKNWTKEPESTFWQRLLVNMFGLLPIESQL